MKNPPTPLTAREQAALDRFAEWVNGRDDSKPRHAVIEQLTAGDFEHDEADRLIDQLLSKGYLYEADGIRLINGEGSRE
jgi:hypothetical protein